MILKIIVGISPKAEHGYNKSLNEYLSICFLVLLEDQELYETTCRLKCTLLNAIDEEIA